MEDLTKILLAAAAGSGATLLTQTTLRAAGGFESWATARKIRKGLHDSGIGAGVSGLTLTVWNRSGVAVEIREVLFRCGQISHQMSPVRAHDKASGMLDFYDIMAKGYNDAPPVVQPHAGYTFALAYRGVEHLHDPFEGFKITAAFKNAREVTKLVAVDYHHKPGGKGWGLRAKSRLLNERIFANFMGNMKNGSLNEARAKFCLPPFPVPQSNKPPPS